MSAISRVIQVVGGPAKVAELLGVSVQAVCFWRDGKRQMPVDHCAALERASEGKVTRRDLRPDDWHRIWPELVTKQHPAPEPKPTPTPDRTSQEAA